MDAFRLAAELRHYNLNRIPTTKDIQVSKLNDLPDSDADKHLDSGLCLMMHTTDKTVVEIRGIDDTGSEFSYRFHLERGVQPLAMRAVSAHGDERKLKVTLEDSENDSGIKLTRLESALKRNQNQ